VQQVELCSLVFLIYSTEITANQPVKIDTSFLKAAEQSGNIVEPTKKSMEIVGLVIDMRL
jgi:hypothetical protein